MDVVYLVRDGGHNEQLRYSLRSLVNFPHDRVWVVGGGPAWLIGVQRVALRQHGRKFADVPRKLLAACQHLETSDPFWLFNDDFFVPSPLQVMPVLHQGPLLGQARGWSRGYVDGARRAADLLTSWGHGDLLSYELHVPLPVYKAAFTEAWQRAAFAEFEIPTFFRSLHGNYAGLGGRPSVDGKVRDCDSLPDPDAPVVSTTERTFGKGEVGRWLRRRFPRPGQYETKGRR